MKAKKVLSGALAAILLTLTPGVAVCAEEMAGQEQTENTQVLSAQEQENQEKAASYAEKIDTNEISNWPQGPAIYAASGIVMDMNSGAVLYAKKAEEKRYPASITKVLSVLTALQYAKMSDTVVFSEDSISFLQWDDAQIGMKPGEEISILCGGGKCRKAVLKWRICGVYRRDEPDISGIGMYQFKLGQCKWAS